MAKGQVAANAAMSNNFRLEIAGLPPIYFARVGEISREIKVAELADMTAQSTGQVAPITLEADQYLHHNVEVIALETLHRAAEAGAPGYKVATGLLYFLDTAGNVVRSYLLSGLWIMSRKTPELNAGDDGTGVLITWGFSADDAVMI